MVLLFLLEIPRMQTNYNQGWWFLPRFAFQLFAFLTECFVIHKRSIEAFSGGCNYSSQDGYTGEKSKVLLKKMIEFKTNFKK